MLKKLDSADYTLLALLAALLFPVFYFPYFVTLDGPSHAYTAFILKTLLSGGCENISEFFELTKGPVPNWGQYFLFIPFTYLFGMEMADKLVVSVCIITFLLSVRSLLNIISPQNKFLIVIAAILVYSPSLLSGNYSFLLSVALCFFSFGWWLKNSDNFKLTQLLKLSLITITLYFCHIMGLMLFLLAIGFHTLFLSRSFKEFFRKSLFIGTACIIPFALFAWYFMLPKMVTGGYIPFSRKTMELLIPSSVAVFSYQENYLTLAFIASLWSFIIAKNLDLFKKGKPKRKDFFFLAFAIFMIIILLFSPSYLAGGWNVEHRISLFYLCILILSLAPFTYSNLEKRLIITLFLTIFVGLQVLKLYNANFYSTPTLAIAKALDKTESNKNFLFMDINPTIIAYDPDKTILSIPYPLNPPYHYDKKCIVMNFNFHAAEKNSFPVKYKDNYNPHYNLGIFRTDYALSISPPALDLKSYKDKTGKNIDYIIVRGDEKHLANFLLEHSIYPQKLYENLQNQLADYDLVYEDKINLIRLYKLKTI